LAGIAWLADTDRPATSACLAVIDKRCKLLGLFPKENGPSLLISAANGEGGPLPQVMVTFHVPQGSTEDSPDGLVHYPDYQPKALPPPREMERDPVSGTWFEKE
jgi:hypothetical protein